MDSFGESKFAGAITGPGVKLGGLFHTEAWKQRAMLYFKIYCNYVAKAGGCLASAVYPGK